MLTEYDLFHGVAKCVQNLFGSQERSECPFYIIAVYIYFPTILHNCTYKFLLVSQRIPVNPVGHAHDTPVAMLLHVPPFSQDVDWHVAVSGNELLINITPAL